MKDYTVDSPVFSDSIKIVETTDTNHADNINAAVKQLHQNTLVLKKQAGIPDEYDPEGTYEVGDTVSRGGTIYRCTEKISEGEEWTPEHWQEISTIAEIEKSLEQTTRIENGVDLLIRNLVPMDTPIYGFIVHEGTDQNPDSRVEYIGANKDFTPMKMNMETHVMDYGSWKDWSWLKGVVPVMCGWDGEIDYYLDPNDYTKKADGKTASDVSNAEYKGDAMVVFPLIYTCEYKLGTDRVVMFCEKKLNEDFLPIGFNVGGKVRPYMLGPMFYGSIDTAGKMRSIAGQWSCRTASGSADDVSDASIGEIDKKAGIGTDQQYQALQNASKNALFFGGPLTNTLADICIMLSKSTNSQTAFGAGMNNSYVNDKEQHYGTKINTVIGGGMFYGSNDNTGFNKIFHSVVLGSYMLWQRDPYMVSVNGRIKVSVDYTYDPTGAKYLDTGIDFTPGDTNVHYFPSYNVVKGYGPVPSDDQKDAVTTATGYCDGTWANAAITAVSLRFGHCTAGLYCGLWARSLLIAVTHAWWFYGASKLLPAPAAA